MVDFLVDFFVECWKILVESAPYVLFGFFSAGILKAYLPDKLIAKHLGGQSAASVLKASIFGVPLPLCSCGVIPAAVELRKQGAGKGATAAFLVSVPETGVDSVAITWALLDPVMTILRPIFSLITAMTAGLLVNILPDNQPLVADASADKTCCCSVAEAEDSLRKKKTHFMRLRDGLTYAFGTLLGDIGKWLLIGIGVASLISTLVPADFFARYFDNEFLSLVLMLGIGIPLYICASASTPVAAALVLKGLSPGAALVFLLAGPATNAATITVVSRYLGKSAIIVYLASIAFCSLLLGWLTNIIYRSFSLDVSQWGDLNAHHSDSFLMQLCAIVLVVLILKNLRKGR